MVMKLTDVNGADGTGNRADNMLFQIFYLQISHTFT